MNETELSEKENFRKQQGEEEVSLSIESTEEKASKSCRCVETVCWESFGEATPGPGGAFQRRPGKEVSRQFCYVLCDDATSLQTPSLRTHVTFQDFWKTELSL